MAKKIHKKEVWKRLWVKGGNPLYINYPLCGFYRCAKPRMTDDYREVTCLFCKKMMAKELRHKIERN